MRETVAVALEEYRALKAEIAQRSQAQLSLVQLNVTGVGLIVGAFFTEILDARVLFIIPVLSPMLGLLWLDHATAIRHHGVFIQEEVKTYLEREVGSQLPDYETFVRGLELRRLERGLLLAVPIFILFCLLPLTALAIPFGLNALASMKEELLLFALPGAGMLFVFSLYWLRFAWVRPARRKQLTAKDNSASGSDAPPAAPKKAPPRRRQAKVSAAAGEAGSTQSPSIS